MCEAMATKRSKYRRNEEKTPQQIFNHIPFPCIRGSVPIHSNYNVNKQCSIPQPMRGKKILQFQEVHRRQTYHPNQIEPCSCPKFRFQMQNFGKYLLIAYRPQTQNCYCFFCSEMTSLTTAVHRGILIVIEKMCIF